METSAHTLENPTEVTPQLSIFLLPKSFNRYHFQLPLFFGFFLLQKHKLVGGFQEESSENWVKLVQSSHCAPVLMGS